MLTQGKKIFRQARDIRYPSWCIRPLEPLQVINGIQIYCLQNDDSDFDGPCWSKAKNAIHQVEDSIESQKISNPMLDYNIIISYYDFSLRWQTIPPTPPCLHEVSPIRLIVKQTKIVNVNKVWLSLYILNFHFSGYHLNKILKEKYENQAALFRRGFSFYSQFPW